MKPWFSHSYAMIYQKVIHNTPRFCHPSPWRFSRRLATAVEGQDFQWRSDVPRSARASEALNWYSNDDDDNSTNSNDMVYVYLAFL